MSLSNYALKRAILTIPVLIGISFVVFLLMKLMPGNPVTIMLPPEARSPEVIAALEERLGLNRPIHEQYIAWLSHVIRGDLGRSYLDRSPVLYLIFQRIPATVQLAAVAFGISLIIAVPAGILSAVYKDTWIDHFGRIFAFLGISIPNFWMGIMLILVFSLFWQSWFGTQLIPSGGYATPSDGLVVWLRHILPPGITLGVAFSAITARMTRSAMVEVLNQEYITTARSKGVKESAVIVLHGFRNALIPVVTVLGMQIGYLLNGSIIVEQVFRWPGIGRLLYNSVVRQDIPVVQGIVLFVALVFVVSNLIVDILYAYLDPRIRY
jgi:peptide/nickel transport system permease protein